MRIKIAFYILPIFFCLSAASAQAATYYVATDGNDSNAGAITSPFRTIQKGVDTAGAGDVVIVRNGTYGISASCAGGNGYAVNINKAGTSSAWITVRAENKFGAVLDGEDQCHSYINFGANAAYWTVSGFKVTRGYNAGFWSNSGADFITVKGNEIYNIGRHRNDTAYGEAGVYAGANSTDLVFDGNIFHDIGRTDCRDASGALCAWVYKNDHGLYLHSQNTLVINNVFYMPIMGWAVQTASDFSGTIANNTFKGPHTNGVTGLIVLWSNNGAVKVQNNIFYRPITSAIAIEGWSSPACMVTNNIVFGVNSLASGNGSISGCQQANNSLNTDPLMVNPTATPPDFHLQSSSPAINAGITLSDITTDIEGTIRPQGSAYDIGADEYGSAGSSQATPTPTPSPSGNTYYVATTGNDTNAGTIGSPFRTIKKGVSLLNPGDTVLVRAGTYTDSIDSDFMTVPGGTSWSNPVTIAVYPGENVTLRPGAGTNFVFHFAQPSNQFIVIDGFKIDYTNVAYDAIKITWTSLGDAHHIRVKNCEIFNTNHSNTTPPGLPILVNRNSHYNEFQNLTIHDSGYLDTTGEGHVHGLYIQSDHNLIENNRIYNMYSWGISIYNGYAGESADFNVIRNNIVYGNSPVGGRGGGIGIDSGSGNIVYNNLSYNNAYGIHVDYGARDSKVYNNTVSNNRFEQIYVGTGSTNAILRNNIAFGSTPLDNVGIGTVLDHNVFGADPKFVSATDFHLQSSSPAINAGTTLGEVTTDLDGITRPQGSAYDIGAYEYGAGSTSPTPTPIPQSCQNPTPIPSGFSAPCPVFGVSPASGSLSQNFTASVKPDASKTVWIYKTMYITEGSSWKSITLPGTVQYTYWLQGNVTYNFQPTTLGLTAGTHYLASWDWTWDAANQCYKGPGSTACGGGQYRIQQISVQ